MLKMIVGIRQAHWRTFPPARQTDSLACGGYIIHLLDRLARLYRKGAAHCASRGRMNRWAKAEARERCSLCACQRRADEEHIYMTSALADLFVREVARQAQGPDCGFCSAEPGHQPAIF